MKFSSAFFVVLTSFVVAGSASSVTVKAGVVALSNKVAALDKAVVDLSAGGTAVPQSIASVSTPRSCFVYDDDTRLLNAVARN
jgi:NhaP-type Na+/H+ and K+/H+ antiporter